MKSIISQKLNGKFKLVILMHRNELPESYIQPSPSQKGCIMIYFAQVAVHRKTAVFDRDTCCCTGAKAGLGFGNGYYDSMPGGVDTFSAFFSKGLESAEDKKQYKELTEKMNHHDRQKFLEGERFFTSRERARKWITEELPAYNFKEKYAILKPLENLSENEVPKSVIFIVNPLELTALMTLAGSIRNGINTTITPQSSACQMIGAQVFRQAESKDPSAVLGFIDLAARIFTRKLIPDEYLTYAVPWKLYLDMEQEAEAGIFESPIWENLQ
jgi:hypothetical protein